MTIAEEIAGLKEALTIEQLARMLNLSPKTLYKQVKSGRLPAYRIGASVRLDPARTAVWLNARITAGSS